MTLSDLPMPPKHRSYARTVHRLRASGIRFTLFGVMRIENFSVNGAAINVADGTYLRVANYACEMGNPHCP